MSTQKPRSFHLAELAALLEVDPEQLAGWQRLLPPTKRTPDDLIYVLESPAQLALWRKRALVLRTQMTQDAVASIEQAGLLDAYAGLALDCPPGLTAHVWRSYAVVVAMQSRYNHKLGARDLAERAKLKERDESGRIVPGLEMARRHLRLLQALGYLKDAGERWEHRGLPSAWQGR